jgi:hypothetical protein
MCERIVFETCADQNGDMRRHLKIKGYIQIIRANDDFKPHHEERISKAK